MSFSAAVGMRPSIDLCIFIGRCQPFHNGHFAVIKQAMASGKFLLFLLGSAGEPRNYYNPWTFEERKAMILVALPAEWHDRILILPQVDYPYNNQQWIIDVQDAAREAMTHFGLGQFPNVALIGHSKDKSSFYLKFFPQWAAIEVQNYKGLSATPMRDAFFNEDAFCEKIDELFPDIPEPVQNWIWEFSKSPAWGEMIDEYDFIRTYRKQFENLPYPPIFVTVDACVVQSGHVLLVKRRGRPGRGLLAMPGGFLNADERIDDAVYRELREETKIKVPEPVLRGSTVASRVFDHPFRSARGRTITHASLIKLPDATELARVKGADDAEKAFWMPIADVRRDQMFEDHFSILHSLVSQL